MDHEIRVSDDGSYIILRLIGPTGRHQMAYIVAAHTLGAEKGIQRYLVDLREATNRDSAFDSYEMAYHDFPATPQIAQLARVAGLITPGDRSHDFLVTVFQNSGQYMALFEDLAAAERFLKGGPPSP